MKCKEVLKLLRVTRPTLCSYVKKGIITAKLLPNGTYNYDEDSVYKVFNKNLKRKNVIYCRVSTSKQKADLESQEETIKQFMNKNGIAVDDVYKDIGSGINYDRKEFNRLLNDIINHKIDTIFITYKDRLSRISFDMFKNLFEEFNCQIVVLNDIDDEKLIEKEIFNEIISLIHCFSMKMYSTRRKEKLKLVEQDLILEEEYK